MGGVSSLYNYNNFWDGSVGGRGYWGRTPPYQPNVFSKNYDPKDHMYMLNPMSSFASTQFPGFDSMLPYYTPNGAGQYDFVKSENKGVKSNDYQGVIKYDINDPRTKELYHKYKDFFNIDLDRLSRLSKYQNHPYDLNSDFNRKIRNPKSF